MAGQSPMLTETTMPPQIGIIPKKQTVCIAHQAK